MPAPNIISHTPRFFDVCLEHDPPGTEPRDNHGALRIRCWLKRIPAFNSEQAAEKAETFLREQRGVGNIEAKLWRYSKKPKGIVQ